MFQDFLSSQSFYYEGYPLMKTIFSNVREIISDTHGFAGLESIFTVIESLSLSLFKDTHLVKLELHTALSFIRNKQQEQTRTAI